MLMHERLPRLGWPVGAVALLLLMMLIALALAGPLVGGSSRHAHEIDLGALVQWRPIHLLEADSPRARRMNESAVPVILPDNSRAKLLIDREGLPRALILRPSNLLVGQRERVLEAGAAMTEDQSLLLSATTDQGQTVDVLLKPTGDAAVAAAPSEAQSAVLDVSTGLSAGNADSRNSIADR